MRPRRCAPLAALAALLALATLGTFGSAMRNGFVNLDDVNFILRNSQLQNGVTREALAWAFTTSYSGNWYPLAWISHMLDVQLFGMHPAGHHATSVLLHAASAVLLFLALTRMTGARVPSLFAAALFALHPLRVESVAWVAERKDVLCGLAWMLGLAAYSRYLGRPTVSRYLVVVAVFALGALSKPMIVTLPFVLLLLDFWPFGRLAARRVSGRDGTGRTRALARVVAEKVPLLAISAAASVVTYVVQRESGALGLEEPFHAGARYTTALMAYARYLQKSFWPLDLAVYYPISTRAVPPGTIVAAATLLVALSGLVLSRWRRRPYLAVGWLWFLGTLFPVAGIVKAGSQSYADRYTYLPLIGVSLALTWLAVQLSQRRPRLLAGAATLTLCLLAALTVRQIGVWRDSTALWGHAARVTAGNSVALSRYAVELLRAGRDDEALACLREARQGHPDPQALMNVAQIFEDRGNLVEAGKQYSQVIAMGAASPEAYFRLGNVLARRQLLGAAIGNYREATRLLPNYSAAWNRLGVALASLGRPEEARRAFAEAMRTSPGNVEAQGTMRRGAPATRPR